MADSQKPVWQKLLHYEPHLGMGQWLLDRITANWPWLLPTIGAGVMFRLAQFADALKPYGHVAWGAIALLSALILVLIRAAVIWGTRIKIRNRYDARMLSGNADFNPLDKTFVGKRIFVNDFALPSHPYIEDKIFVDCDIIGPANLYWFYENYAHPIRAPIIDVVILDPDKKFNSGFILKNCRFTNCSFQRITIFAGTHLYDGWKGNENINLISYPPTQPQLPHITEVEEG